MHVQTSTSIDCTANAAGEARAFVAVTLHDWGSQSVLDDALLLVSELVTNAVRHGGCETAALEVARDDHEIIVSVHDHSPAPSSVRPPSPNSVGGFGLQIVDRVANRWGTESEDLGKTVWFALPLPDVSGQN